MPKLKKGKGAVRTVSFVFLAAIIIGIFCNILVAPRALIVYSDVTSFLTGGLMIKENYTGNIYDMENQLLYQQRVVAPTIKEEVLPFKNMPIFSLPFIPLAYFPLNTSYRIFAIFNLFLLGAFAYWSTKVFVTAGKTGFLYLAPFLYLPNIISVIVGQISIIMSVTVLFLYRLFQKKKYFIAGVLSGLLLVKMQYATVTPFLFLIAKNKKRFLSGLVMVLFILAVSSVYFAGTGALAGYPSFLLQTENASFGTRPQRMLTISSTLFYLKPIFRLGYLYALYLNAFLYLGTLFLFAKRYKLVELGNSFSSAITISILFAVHVLEHDLTILLVPAFILANNAAMKARKERGYYIFVAVLMFLLPAIVIFLSPVIGTISAAFIALSLLFPEKTQLTKRNILAKTRAGFSLLFSITK